MKRWTKKYLNIGDDLILVGEDNPDARNICAVKERVIVDEVAYYIYVRTDGTLGLIEDAKRVK